MASAGFGQPRATIISGSRKEASMSSRRKAEGYNDAGQYDDGDDDDDDDTDSGDTGSDYSSVAGDASPLIHAYGHTYHGSGRIYFPNDGDEDERMRLQHELYQLCLDGRLHDMKLPIENPDARDDNAYSANGAGHGTTWGDTDDSPSPSRPRFQILDVGVGNGVWALDVARRYPEADILGIDMSSHMLPKDVPPNLTFEVADVTEPWPPRLYDFIHIRNIVGGGVGDWERLMHQVICHLKPGGALEFSDIRPQFHRVSDVISNLPPAENLERGDAVEEFQRRLVQFTREQGVELDPIPRVMSFLRHAPVEDLRERVDWLHAVTYGNDPIMKRKEDLIHGMIDLGLEIWSMMLFGRAGCEENETRNLLQRVREDTRDPTLRSCFNLTFITARKPVDRIARDNPGSLPSPETGVESHPVDSGIGHDRE